MSNRVRRPKRIRNSKFGAEVYSVSTDTHFTHKAYDSSDGGKITHTMIGDPSHEISRNFDVLIEEAGQGRSWYIYYRPRRSNSIYRD